MGPAKKAVAKKQVEESSEDLDSSEEEDKKKITQKKPIRKSSSVSKNSTSRKQSTASNTKKAVNTKAKAAPKKVVEEDSDDESDDESEETPAVTKKPAKAAPAKKKSAKVESSESEEEEEEEESEEVKPVASKKARKESDVVVHARKNSGGLANMTKQQPKTDAGNTDMLHNEVIVKGLPFTATEDDIWTYFAECGEVASINLLKGYDGASKGCGFVRFVDGSSVAAAEACSGSDFGGRKIFVEMTKPKNQRDQGQGRNFNDDRKGGDFGAPRERRQHSNEEQTVFVGNLSFNTDVDKLWEFFGPCGNIKDVRIGKRPDGSSRGFAHIEFDSTDGVSKAMGYAGRKLDGRALNVDSSTKKSGDGGNARGGFGGGRGGFGGGRGGGRGGRPNDEGLNARKGNIDLNAANACVE